jgi:putative glutamine amidotransferase
MERQYVNSAYITSVLNAGGIPVLLPVITDLEGIKSQINGIDGIILSGGEDVGTLLYGEEPMIKQGFFYPERDEYEINLAKIAHSQGKPIFGICRGMQVLNVAFGGTLYQDLSYFSREVLKHRQESRRGVGTHTVEILKGTKLYEIFGDRTVANSFHHQAVKDVAPGFLVSAVAKDEIIEAMEWMGEEYIVAVQWDPEEMSYNNLKMLELFKKLVQQLVKENGENVL